VLNQIIASRPDFHVLAGDIAYADPSGLNLLDPSLSALTAASNRQIAALAACLPQPCGSDGVKSRLARHFVIGRVANVLGGGGCNALAVDPLQVRPSRGICSYRSPKRTKRAALSDCLRSEFNPWGVDEVRRLIQPCQTIEKSRTFLVFVGGRGFV
jgi:hypothetical protein